MQVLNELALHHLAREESSKKTRGYVRVLRKQIGLPDPIDIIRSRQFKTIGKIIRMDNNAAPKKLLNACVPKPRPVGKPKSTIRHTYVETLHDVLQSDPRAELVPHGQLKGWAHPRDSTKGTSADIPCRQQVLSFSSVLRKHPWSFVTPNPLASHVCSMVMETEDSRVRSRACKRLWPVRGYQGRTWVGRF